MAIGREKPPPAPSHGFVRSRSSIDHQPVTELANTARTDRQPVRHPGKTVRQLASAFRLKRTSQRALLEPEPNDPIRACSLLFFCDPR